ncbi:MAG: hypothetical protein QM642_07110 [Edaphocola sp.]
MSEAKVVVPSEEELEQIGKEIEPYFEKIKSNTAQIKTLQTLRDSLLPKLMSGEIKVVS